MGKLIRQAREQLGMSQEELAGLMYRRRASLSEMENGKMEPDASTLTYLASALHKPIMYFFPEEYARRLSLEGNLTPTEEALLIEFRRLGNERLQQVAVNQVRNLADLNDY
ncbi:helix-turn-helix transcriptional regulator [Aggregatilinea lenta]|uniref:helix-turn-helix transcriptional regulator n=1 Tax=Aggregatilinea lenta TaxID=913108 RepID=UPI0023B18709|nr:helix-turn-helix transcriptional regulator [Aggregatilinea lenta]